MPGIVGLITNKRREYAVPELQRMVEALRHESFYETGTWTDESLGVYVGWVARKNSFPAMMPIEDKKGGRALVFSGEEFSDSGIAMRSKQKGHALGMQRESYLLGLAEEEESFPACLNGRFHGLLVDKVSEMALLFNDRYGMHRVYYHATNDTLYFSAEAKAILAVCPELRAIDPRGMGEFVSCGCVLENRSIFKGISVLPPASAWKFRRGSLERKDIYFEPKEWEEQGTLDAEAYYQQLREVFSRSIPKYCNGPERISMSLTGGLDSRMIMAWHKSPADSFPCFSFGGMFRDCEDVTVARKVARVCKQKHQVLQVGDEFLAKFPHYSERSVYLTDGCVDVSRSSDLYLNERAREIAPVRMTGNYGGEVLRGLRVFKPMAPPPELFHADFSGYLVAAKQTYAGLISVHPLSFSAFRQAPWHHYGLLALEQTQLNLRSPFLDNELVRTVYRAPMSTLSRNDVCLRLIEDGNTSLSKLRTDMGLAGNPGLISSIRREYLKFTFKAEYAYDYGMPQWVARTDHALSAIHPERLFLGRHKFNHFRIWYRDALANYIREMLLDSRTLARPYLQRKSVEGIVAGHLKGDRNYTMSIHKILTLEHLHRLFIDPR